jgi:serine/threonine-protein kinase RsbW
MQKRFSRDIASLQEVFDFVAAFLRARSIPESNSFNVHFVVEELFTNSVKYSPEGDDIAVAITTEDAHVVIRFTDHSVRPFDVTKDAPTVNTKAGGEERKVGGLGIHLVRSMARDVSYRHVDGNSEITVKLPLEE